MELSLTGVGHPESVANAWRQISGSVLDILSFLCTLDLQEEMLSRQLDTEVCSSVERSGLKIFSFKSWAYRWYLKPAVWKRSPRDKRVLEKKRRGLMADLWDTQYPESGTWGGNNKGKWATIEKERKKTRTRRCPSSPVKMGYEEDVISCVKCWELVK